MDHSDLQDVAQKLDLGLATDAFGDSFLTHAFPTEQRDLSEADKGVTVIVSTSKLARDGDVLESKGIDLKAYKKNPVVLWCHDYKALPVAKSEFIRYEKVDGGRLIGRPIFHLETELSREVWVLVKRGVLRAWSLGFIPLKVKPLPKPKKSKKTDDGEEDVSGPFGHYSITKSELVEYSSVPVPADPHALTLGLRALHTEGVSLPELEHRLRAAGYEIPELVPANVRDMEEVLTQARVRAVEEARAAKTEVETPQVTPQVAPQVERGVISPKDYGTASPETAWDAGKEVKAASPADLRKMCAWVKSGAEDLKTSYKFPHHRQSDTKCVWRGVANAMARLDQSNIPAGDKSGVRAHLAYHYKQFDKEVPKKEADPETRVEETDEYIHIPIRNKDLFRKPTFRTVTLSADQGIKSVQGKLKANAGKDKDPMVIQKYLFEKAMGWTVEKAKNWVKDHKKSCDLVYSRLYEAGVNPVGLELLFADTATERHVIMVPNAERIGKEISAKNVKRLQTIANSLRNAATSLDAIAEGPPKKEESKKKAVSLDELRQIVAGR